MHTDSVGKVVASRYNPRRGNRSAVGVDALNQKVAGNKLILEMHNELVQECGGNPTAKQRMLIERVCMTTIRAMRLDADMLAKGEENERAIDCALRSNGNITRLLEELRASVIYQRSIGSPNGSGVSNYLEQSIGFEMPNGTVHNPGAGTIFEVVPIISPNAEVPWTPRPRRRPLEPDSAPLTPLSVVMVAAPPPQAVVAAPQAPIVVPAPTATEATPPMDSRSALQRLRACLERGK